MSGTATSSVGASDELGSYQSLHGLAVLSFVLGLLSILAFAPFWLFIWLFPPAAVLSGVLALWRISEAPEVWAGKKLALAGIGLAFIFAVLAIARDSVQGQHIKKYARAVADRFVEKIQAGEMESAYWLTFPRDVRQEFANREMEKLPEGLLERYGNFRMESSALLDAIGQPDAKITFERVENAGVERGTQFAQVLYKVHSSRGERHLLIVATGHFSQVWNDEVWWIREQKFDYEPGSFKTPQPSDHGHSH